MMATGAQNQVENLGVFTPRSQSRESLSAGEVGFIIAGIKELQSAKVGDTITLAGKASDRAATRFQGSATTSVRWIVPRRIEPVRCFARLAGETQA